MFEMQMFAFFLAMFTSTGWLIYATMFVRSKLEAEGLWEQSPELLYQSAESGSHQKQGCRCDVSNQCGPEIFRC